MTREDELYADELRDRAYSDYERLDLAINELERQTNTRSQRKVRNQMKIMIDIDKDVYTRLFDNGIQDNEIAVDDICEMARALRLGTPLQALEQQPCEDCVSREAVIEHICEDKECYKEECKGRTLKRCPDLQWVFDLPSVTPKYTDEEIDKAQAVEQAYVDKMVELAIEEIKERYSDAIGKMKKAIDEMTEIHSDGEFYIKNVDAKWIIGKYLCGAEMSGGGEDGREQE